MHYEFCLAAVRLHTWKHLPRIQYSTLFKIKSLFEMKVKESFFRDLLRIFVWYPIRWLIKLIPVDWGFFLFKVMGDVHFYAGGWKKRKFFGNIQRSLNTGRNTKDIVKKCFEMHYIDRLHIFFYPKLARKKEIENYVYI